MSFLIAFAAVSFSAGFWLWMIRRKDRYAPEPFWFLCKVALVGGILSIIPSGILNSIVVGDLEETSVPSALLKYGFVGFNEELWKLAAAIYLINNHHHFDEPVDGVIYAATVGLGFAAIENIEYISVHGLSVLVTRHFLSVPGHIAFAMLWGYGLTLAKFKYPERHWLIVIWPFYLAAAICHGFYNFSLMVFPALLNLACVIALIVYIYRISTKRCRQLLLHSPMRPAGHCPECDTGNTANSRYCRNCGTHLLVQNEFRMLRNLSCSNCSGPTRANDRFCMLCGKPTG